MKDFSFTTLFFLHLAVFSLLSGTHHLQIQLRLEEELAACEEPSLSIRLDYHRYELTCTE